MKKYYYCENGAFHSYECCDTCWNKHPIAQKYEDGYFDKECRAEINESEHKLAVEEAVQVGFTKKQSEYLCKNKGASFQQVVL